MLKNILSRSGSPLKCLLSSNVRINIFEEVVVKRNNIILQKISCENTHCQHVGTVDSDSQQPYNNFKNKCF